MEHNTYKTRQKMDILNFLKININRQLTCVEITDGMKAEGYAVGKTTVYRYLTRLHSEGSVRKISDQAGKGAKYQYIDKSMDCADHLHFKCLSCGDFHHLSCSFMKGISEHLSSHHSFTVDNSKTIIYGLCEKCSVKE